MSYAKATTSITTPTARPELSLRGGRRAVIFTRWSRKAYASFLSLHCEVMIGRLRANVVERLLKKSGYKAAPQRPGPIGAEHLKTCDDSDDPAATRLLLLFASCGVVCVEPVVPQLGRAYASVAH